ncbi:viral A-type inclusion protein [Reticulomyxa filosa]|uniref:Viral A-type inclusion protein n=1 Tax=Reticulomyxa filosa TaxID=46433 RepID=X6P248_RETFI|nr:viral A-type inclusion protein [Reticulomyxa filosa]|eukprot:ETO31632.1 viral A-type inclusion protein [Reticulomyxa filosa]
MAQFREVFNFYDNDNGRLGRDICQELLRIVGENEEKVNLLFSPPCSFDRFLYGWDILQRSLTYDILPALQRHTKQVFCTHYFSSNKSENSYPLCLCLTKIFYIVYTYIYITDVFLLQPLNLLTGLYELQLRRDLSNDGFGTDDDHSSSRKKQGRGRMKEKDPELGKALGRRPSIADLVVKNILWNDPSVDPQSQLNERQLHRRRTSELLDQRLADRPDINSLVERGIIVELNDSFVAEAGAAMQRVHNLGLGERERRVVTKTITDLLTQHNMTVQDMNQRHIEKMKEQKRLHEEAHKEARRRERKLRSELDSRARLLVHNKGIIERYEKEKKELQHEMEEEMKKMKEDYEEQMRILQESTRIPITTSIPTSQQMNADFSQHYRNHVQALQHLQQSMSLSSDTKNSGLANSVLQQVSQLNDSHNNQIERQKKELTNAFQTQMNTRKGVHDEELAKMQEHHDSVLKAKNTEIEKLKQQKREMAQVIEKKLQNLQYTHEREIEKERNIVAMLQQNLKDQKDAFLKQMSNRQSLPEPPKENQSKTQNNEKDAEIARLKTQVQNLSQVNRQVVVENEKLKKSKDNLEQQIVILSDQIVQMSNKVNDYNKDKFTPKFTFEEE